MSQSRRIVIACTFREFDGSVNDAIQHEFLTSLQKLNHQNFVLVVTNFNEQNVEATLTEFGLPFELVQSTSGQRVCMSEVWYNAAKQIESDDDIFLFTNVDHVFAPAFFDTICLHMGESESLVSFPQIVFDNLDDFHADQSLEAQNAGPSLNRGAPDLGDTDCLPPMFRNDPNHWLPDIVAVDGGIMRQPETQQRFMRYRMDDVWPGISQNVMLGFLAPQGKRKNLFFQGRYKEILNNYKIDTDVNAEGRSYTEVRTGFAAHNHRNFEMVRQYASEIGVAEISHIGSPLCKLEQLAQYEVIGTSEQRAAYLAYLKLWKLRYLIKHRAVVLDDKARAAEAAFVKEIRENLKLADEDQSLTDVSESQGAKSVA